MPGFKVQGLGFKVWGLGREGGVLVCRYRADLEFWGPELSI